MNKITKKEFINLLTSNKSEFLRGGYIAYLKKHDLIEYLNNQDYSKLKGELRQGFVYSNGLRFLTPDGSYSYLTNLINYEYYQVDNVLITIKVFSDSTSVIIYRLV